MRARRLGRVPRSRPRGIAFRTRPTRIIAGKGVARVGPEGLNCVQFPGRLVPDALNSATPGASTRGQSE